MDKPMTSISPAALECPKNGEKTKNINLKKKYFFYCKKKWHLQSSSTDECEIIITIQTFSRGCLRDESNEILHSSISEISLFHLCFFSKPVQTNPDGSASIHHLPISYNPRNPPIACDINFQVKTFLAIRTNQTTNHGEWRISSLLTVFLSLAFAGHRH